MALLFMDGFDHYLPNVTLTNKWNRSGNPGSFGTWVSIAGRFGGQAHQVNQGNGSVMSLSHDFLQTPSTIIVGCAFRCSSTLGDLFTLYDLTAGAVQLTLTAVANGKLRVYRNTTANQLGSDTAINTILTGTWHYVEMKANIHNSAGTVQVWVDGVSVLSLASMDTQHTANAYVNRVYAGGGVVTTSVGQWDIDDFYALDTNTGLGSDGNPLGDCRVVTLLPTGNSADNPGHLAWDQTGGTGGNHWTSVNENPHNSDTSYVSSDVTDEIESFTHAALPAAVTSVKALQFNLVARKDDAGTRIIAPTQRNSTTDSVGVSSSGLTASYVDFMSIAENSLQTATAWTVSEVNASEFGVKVIA